MTETPSEPAERLYLIDDEELGIKRNPFPQFQIDRMINRYNKAIDLADIQGGLWLDAGCGSGYGTSMVSKVADYIVGIDNSASAILYAKKHYDSHNIHFNHDNLQTVESWVDSLFNVILCVEVIEHLQNPMSIIAKFASWLKDDGILILTTPLADNSQPKPVNTFHKYEFTAIEFKNLINSYFPRVNIQIDAPQLFTNGRMTKQMFARGIRG